MAKVKAFVNHGRWIAQCPGCNSAVVQPAGDKKYACSECGATHSVSWPKTSSEINTILAPRPLLNQNWLPGETLDDLRAENAAHGVN